MIMTTTMIMMMMTMNFQFLDGRLDCMPPSPEHLIPHAIILSSHFLSLHDDNGDDDDDDFEDDVVNDDDGDKNDVVNEDNDDNIKDARKGTGSQLVETMLPD